MTDLSTAQTSPLRATRWGLLLSLLSILFGFGFGGVFGIMEDSLKDDLARRAEQVRDSVYEGDDAKMKAVTDKSWSYYKRSHLHAGAIGSVALGVAILLAFCGRTPCVIRSLLSAGLGIGALGYSIFWLLAGMRAPGLGSTGAAKESLEWLAMPTSGLCLLGVIGAIVIVAVETLGRSRKGDKPA